MNPPEPYLSVVATSRNDDHGGSLLRRMQAFVNGFINQAKRHSLFSELILVEWNPPEGRQPLVEALGWPEDTGPCQVRIIEVPPALHRSYRHAENLPLYQMIAKNVGIRRARGRFVLATNIDILFNDELVDFIANGKLQPGKMYRIDRHDVMADVPVNASVEEQIAYCETHLLRINTREGTFPLSGDQRAIELSELRGARPPGMAPEVSVADGSVSFGSGWYPVEQHFGKLFRWAENDAEILLRYPARPNASLVLELEPGPSAGSRPLPIQVVGASGGVFGEFSMKGKTVLQIPLHSFCADGQILRLRAVGGGKPLANDHRILNFRVLRYEWIELPAPGTKRLEVQAVSLGRRLATERERWSRLFRQLGRAKQGTRIGLPFSAWLVRSLGLRIDAGGLSVGLGGRPPGTGSPGGWRERDQKGVPTAAAPSAVETAVMDPTVLHTNACGDFTLMAREHWSDLRGYPEFDAYSFNIDAILCFAAHYAGVREEMLREPLRAYHIEHGLGSGWTPEGQRRLFERLAERDIPYIDWPEVAIWASQMRRLNRPMIFNGENWGLAEHDLRETVLPTTQFGLS